MTDGEPTAGRSTTPDPGASVAPPGPTPEPPASGVPDPSRRRFFRLLAADAIQTAAQVVGVATALQRSSAEAAAALLDDVSRDDAAAAVEAPSSDTGRRSPFRMESDRLVVLDQGRFPFEIVEIECTTGAEVARAIRELAVRGGPAIAQVAAYGLALTAGRARSAKPYVRLATIRGTANALGLARVAPAAPRAAVDRLMARMSIVGELADAGDEIADAMRVEADAIAFETTLDNARLVDAGRAALEGLVRAAESGAAESGAAEATAASEPGVGEFPPSAERAVGEFPSAAERAVGVLTLGSSGALAGGQVGTALGVLTAYAATGRSIHVFVLETRPWLDGSRLAAWELVQAAVPFSILADGAAGWILASGEVDVVLVAADRVARDGSFLAPIGTFGVAVAAASAGVPVWVCAPGAAIDPGAGGVADLPGEMRAASDVLWLRGLEVAAPGATARNPVVDATPGDLVSAFVTDAGVFRPPFAADLAALAAAFATRSPAGATP